MIDVNYSSLPDYMREAARRYIEDGQMPGGFIRAVLCNNLVEAFRRADGTNSACMAMWVSWLYWQIPMESWGSKEKVEAWSTTRIAARKHDIDPNYEAARADVDF